jgi:hypothetical protein
MDFVSWIVLESPFWEFSPLFAWKIRCSPKPIEKKYCFLKWLEKRGDNSEKIKSMSFVIHVYCFGVFMGAAAGGGGQ